MSFTCHRRQRYSSQVASMKRWSTACRQWPSLSAFIPTTTWNRFPKQSSMLKCTNSICRSMSFRQCWQAVLIRLAILSLSSSDHALPSCLRVNPTSFFFSAGSFRADGLSLALIRLIIVPMDQIENVCACKVVVVGQSGVGKTSIVTSYSQRQFQAENLPKVTGTYLASTQVLNTMVNLTVCDTASQQQYQRLRPLAYPRANVFLIVFSVVDAATFDRAVEHWLEEIKENNSQPSIVFVGNKTDLVPETEEGPCAQYKERQYSARRRVQQLGHRYMQCSALSLQGLTGVFEEAISLTLLAKNVPLLKKKSTEGSSGGGCQLI